MKKAPLVHVVGHQCPDTDAVVSAVIAARLLARTRPEADYVPLMQGVANPQTAWLFAEAGVPLPRIRSDVRPTVGEACHAARSLTADRPLGEALDLLHEHGYSIIPIVDAEGRLAGVIGHALPDSRYLTHFNLEDFLGILVTLPELVSGLGLVPLNPAAERAANAPEASPDAAGAFRLHPGGPAPQPGNILLSGAVPDAAATATRAEAAALIHADCTEVEARAWTATSATPAYLFEGSLMALVTQLPRAIPVGRVMSLRPPVAGPDDLLEDLRSLFVRTPHALPVVDPAGKLLGMISRREALQPPRRGLVLVDHFERTQTVRGWEDAEILQIIDHHRVGGLETVEPARVDCRPLGSTASILTLRFEEAGLVPDAAEARLLLGALVADTLLLTSPTTTPTDRALAPRLAALAGVELASFGREVLSRNDGLATETPAALVTRDLKEFSRGELRFLLGQIETVDLALLHEPRALALRDALDAARQRAGAAFALTMVTDVLSGVSRLLLADPDARRARHLLEGEQPATGVERPIVSRKKQLVPLVLERLSTYRP
ncbi:MAG: DHH family phosphoesterase [Burkholderiales bacterium]|nr:DHH family phosphoesterase [Opitutaceae bacterium]